MDVSRASATEQPRSEKDQKLVGGWPLYRTEAGQKSFNAAMATLAATDGAAPGADAFAGCMALDCNLQLPKIDAEGWLAAGRLWVSPNEYVLFVHSPRNADGKPYRRRDFKSMRVFVYHEFHNSTRNTDPYDTISSHFGRVFVPLYMSKQGSDAYGRKFVIVTQIAPYDVISVHASNMGSAGPGMEVAKNYTDKLEPLQALAGVLVGSIIKAKAPHLKVVNHRGIEGRPMLDAYEERLEALRTRGEEAAVALPFVPAVAERVASASEAIGDLILGAGAEPRVASGAPATDMSASEVYTLTGPVEQVTRASSMPGFTLIKPVRRVRRSSGDGVSGG
jgi:hypothetical protein